MVSLWRNRSFFYSFVIFLGLNSLISASTSLTEKIYYNLNSTGYSMCFRRFNATHQIGCSSGRGGNVGVIHLVTNDSDLNWLKNKGPHSPYVVVLGVHMFNRTVFDILVKTGKVNGLVVITNNATDRPDSFSPDSTCPVDRYGLYANDEKYKGCKEVIWNPFGNGLMFEDVPFPMVVVSNDSDINFIVNDCYMKFNQHDVSDMPKGYSLCAMEIKDVMDGAKDTPTCYRRTNLVTNLSPQRYCDPLGSLNIYSYMELLNKSHTLENESVIVIAARLDSFSLFDHRYPGYDSAVLGFVTVHAIAEALGHARERLAEALQNKPIMFALFNGEAFEYIGSSKMVYDLEKNELLPVTLQSIGTFIEIGQVGLHDGLDSIYIHTDPLSKSQNVQNKVKDLSDLVKEIGSQVGLDVRNSPEDKPLPPASMQQFLKSSKTSIAGIFLSNHNESFTNKYYNSMYDTSDDISNTSDSDAYSRVTPTVHQLQKISTTIARTVYTLLLGNTTDNETIESSNTTIANLIYCFTQNSSCELFNMTSEFGKSGYLKFQTSFQSRYVGVVINGETAQVARHHQYLMAHWLGTKVENVTTAEDCQNLEKKKDGYRYLFLNGKRNETDNDTCIPECIRTTANTTAAVSPAFLIDGYDWSSNKYSAWTESSWENDAMRMRIFLLPNPDQEVMTLCVGLALFIFSFTAAFLLSRQAPVIFTPLPAS